MRILLAYDGSESAKRALEQAAELAGSDGRSITVVTVAETIPAVRAGGPMTPPNEERRRARELREATRLLEERGIEAQTVERHGQPANEIVDEAAKEQSDLIVIGTRGLNAAKRVVLGSVSSDVVHRAPCSVLVVR